MEGAQNRRCETCTDLEAEVSTDLDTLATALYGTGATVDVGLWQSTMSRGIGVILRVLTNAGSDELVRRRDQRQGREQRRGHRLAEDCDLVSGFDDGIGIDPKIQNRAVHRCVHDLGEKLGLPLVSEPLVSAKSGEPS